LDWDWDGDCIGAGTGTVEELWRFEIEWELGVRWTVEGGRDLWEDLAATPAKSAVLGRLTAFCFYWFLLVSIGCVQHHVGGLLLRWP
jgi:hypothetical protein